MLWRFLAVKSRLMNELQSLHFLLNTGTSLEEEQQQQQLLPTCRGRWTNERAFSFRRFLRSAATCRRSFVHPARHKPPSPRVTPLHSLNKFCFFSSFFSGTCCAPFFPPAFCNVNEPRRRGTNIQQMPLRYGRT